MNFEHFLMVYNGSSTFSRTRCNEMYEWTIVNNNQNYYFMFLQFDLINNMYFSICAAGCAQFIGTI